jgi:hypothetical protein
MRFTKFEYFIQPRPLHGRGPADFTRGGFYRAAGRGHHTIELMMRAADRLRAGRRPPRPLLAEIEQIEQIPEGGGIQRDIRIVLAHHRIREIVAAALRDRSQTPVAFDEFQDRYVIGGCPSV